MPSLPQQMIVPQLRIVRRRTLSSKSAWIGDKRMTARLTLSRARSNGASRLMSAKSTAETSSNVNPPTSDRQNVFSIPTSHNPTHFIKGGTPCDPQCPPFRLADYGEDSLYTLVLLRHGESEWNSQNRYTGWCDVNLTKRGQMEARTAGRLLFENGIEIDHAFTSVLKRASFSTNMALNTANQHWAPVTKTWRLNERHYGALQGYNKDTAYDELGIDQVRPRKHCCTLLICTHIFPHVSGTCHANETQL